MDLPMKIKLVKSVCIVSIVVYMFIKVARTLYMYTFVTYKITFFSCFHNFVLILLAQMNFDRVGENSVAEIKTNAYNTLVSPQ